MLAALAPNRPTDFLVRRKGREITLKVTAIAKGEFEGRDFDAKRWDMTVKGITRYATPLLYHFNEKRKGAYVQGVRYPGNARNAGLRTSDIITAVRISGKETVRITGVEQFEKVYKRLLADGKREKKVVLTIKRGADVKRIVLDYRKSYKEETKK